MVRVALTLTLTLTLILTLTLTLTLTLYQVQSKAWFEAREREVLGDRAGSVARLERVAVLPSRQALTVAIPTVIWRSLWLHLLWLHSLWLCFLLWPHSLRDCSYTSFM